MPHIKTDLNPSLARTAKSTLTQQTGKRKKGKETKGEMKENHLRMKEKAKKESGSFRYILDIFGSFLFHLHLI